MHPLYNLPFSNAKSINTDLKLIKTYLREEFQPELKPRNLRELSNVLKSHIEKNQRNVQQKKRVRDWLIKKDMRIEPLLKFVKQISTKGIQESQDREINIKIDFIVQPTIHEQESYLKKIVCQNINGLLTQNQTNRGRRKKMIGAFLKQIGFQQGVKKERSQKISNFVGRNEEKKKKYLNITVELIQRDRLRERERKSKNESESERIASVDWALIFSQNINHKLWKIISDQVKSIDRTKLRDSQTTKRLLINSLLSLQRQFQDELPRNSESVSAFLQSKYLSKMEQSGKYIMDPKHGCMWGKAFLYFRAGKLNQLFTLLQNNGLEEQANTIQKCQSKLKQYKPIKERLNVYRSHDQDVFRDQIQYALAGQRKYSCDAISDPDSLDSLWIILRSTGVFYLTDRAAFQDIKQQMIRYYKQHPNPSENYLKFAYLISYQTIIRMGESQNIDKDDYIHLLIMLNKYPFLLPEREDMNLRLAEAISSYGEELSKQKQKTYVEYYLTLLPSSMLEEVGSNIIVANNIFERFSWDIIRNILPQQFPNLLRATAQKYTKETGNYLEGGQVFLHQLKKLELISVECMSSALDMLCRLMIKSALGGKRYDGKDVQKALQIIGTQAGKTPQLSNNYMLLTRFLDNQLTLRKLLIDRNYRKIFQFLQREVSGKTFFASIDFLNGKMLQKLVQLEGQQLFFKYLKNVIRGGDLIFSTENDIENTKWLRYQVLKVCKLIQEHEYFSKIVPEYFLEEISFE